MDRNKMHSVVVSTDDYAIAEENQGYTIDNSDFEESENFFENWLFDDQPGGAMKMLSRYAK